MGLITLITDEIARVENETGNPPRFIELTPRVWYRFLTELPPTVVLCEAAAGEFLGVPIRKGLSSWCCRSCGAPREDASRCGFCLQPYDRITIDDKVLDACL